MPSSPTSMFGSSSSSSSSSSDDEHVPAAQPTTDGGGSSDATPTETTCNRAAKRPCPPQADPKPCRKRNKQTGWQSDPPPHTEKDAAAPFLTEYADFGRRWRAQYRDPRSWRYKMLIIAGPSRTGKTWLAKYGLGLATPLVVSGGFDLRRYDTAAHDGVIFNDVPGIVDKIDRYRDLFQCRDEDTTVGESQTNWASYTANLHKTPLVVVMNLGADYARIVNRDPTNEIGAWIRENARLLVINKPAWAGAAEAAESAEDAAARAEWAAAPEAGGGGSSSSEPAAQQQQTD